MKTGLIALWALVLFCAPGYAQVQHSIYDFKVAAFDNSTIDLAAYKGKKILIVNAPCQANDDPQYAQLELLSKKYNDKLVVIAFLADDFGIEPGTKIRNNYKDKQYNVTFPLADKVTIKGKDRAPIYKWLTEKQYNNFKDSEVKWNFQKYLIDEQGNLIAVFDPKVRPSDRRIIAAIEK